MFGNIISVYSDLDDLVLSFPLPVAGKYITISPYVLYKVYYTNNTDGTYTYNLLNATLNDIDMCTDWWFWVLFFKNAGVQCSK